MKRELILTICLIVSMFTFPIAKAEWKVKGETFEWVEEETQEPIKAKSGDDFSKIPSLSNAYVVVLAQFCDEDGYQGFYEKVFPTRDDVNEFLQNNFGTTKLFKNLHEVPSSNNVWEDTIYRRYGSSNYIRRYLLGVYKLGAKLSVKEKTTEVKRFSKEWVFE